MKKTIGNIELPGGGSLLVKRARATVQQRFAVATPTIKAAVAAAAEVATTGAQGTHDAVIPVEEMEALIAFVCSIVAQVEGVGIAWGEMSHDEREEWLDELGSSALMHIYMRYLWLRVTVDQPELIAEIKGRLAPTSSEEE